MNHFWKEEIGEEELTATKEQTIIVVKKTINELGKQGNGKKFNEKEFSKCYIRWDPMDLNANMKETVKTMVITLLTPAKDK